MKPNCKCAVSKLLQVSKVNSKVFILFGFVVLGELRLKYHIYFFKLV